MESTSCCNGSSRFSQARRPGRRHLHGRPVPATAGLGAGRRRLPFRPVLGHPLGLQGRRQSRRREHAGEGGGDRERPRQPARLHRLHRRPHPHHRRPEGAPRPHAALPRDRLGAARKGRALHAGRARRLARQGRGLQGVLRRARTTRSTTRACISSPSTMSPIPAAKLGDEQLAWLAADLKQRKADDRIVVLTHRPLFDLKPDWDWTTADGAKAIELLMPYQQRRGVLRPHPPGASPHDGPHRPSCGQVADLPARGARARSPSARRKPYDPAHAGWDSARATSAIGAQGELRRTAGHPELKP